LLYLHPAAQQHVQILLAGDSADVHTEHAVGQTKPLSCIARMQAPGGVEALKVHSERDTDDVPHALMLELLQHRLRWCDRCVDQARKAADVTPCERTRASAEPTG
jgi:hypothetical protein